MIEDFFEYNIKKAEYMRSHNFRWSWWASRRRLYYYYYYYYYYY